MSDFQRRDFEGRPLDEQIDNETARSAPSALEMEQLPQGLVGARDAEGAEEVQDALDQVEHGRARPQELLEWIDDIRDAVEYGHVQGDRDVEKTDSINDDFKADSQIAAGDVDNPPVGDIGDDAQRRGGETSDVFGLDDDLDMMFPGRRKKQDGDEEDEDENAAVEKPKPAPAKDKQKSKKP